MKGKITERSVENDIKNHKIGATPLKPSIKKIREDNETSHVGKVVGLEVLRGCDDQMLKLRIFIRKMKSKGI